MIAVSTAGLFGRVSRDAYTASACPPLGLPKNDLKAGDLGI